jgi:hypothetical protein
LILAPASLAFIHKQPSQATMAPSAVSIDARPPPQAKQGIAGTDDQPKEKTALQAISQGICLPGIPLFSEYDKHRAWMLSHM